MSTPRSTSAASAGGSRNTSRPEHIVFLVHGIMASSNDWKYVEAQLKTRLGGDYAIHASACNSFFLTFGGVDRAGKRLAEEVRQVVRDTPGLRRISFVGHSLGGVIARYAIAVLHSPASNDRLNPSSLEASGSGRAPESGTGPSRNSGGSSATDEDRTNGSSGRGSRRSRGRGTIAGLDPVTFISLASPHLGVAGNKQLPFLLGVPLLEKVAAPLAPLFVGRTGRQLFLADGSASERPLLLRMASDCAEAPFISALAAFKFRVLYANAGYDHMVGWRTSSIRRETELPKLPKRSILSRYKHVVNVEDRAATPRVAPSLERSASLSAAQEELRGSVPPRTPAEEKKKKAKYHELEEEMIAGLRQVPWRVVDVSFRGAFWPFFAHNNIHNWAARTAREAADIVALLGREFAVEFTPNRHIICHPLSPLM